MLQHGGDINGFIDQRHLGPRGAPLRGHPLQQRRLGPAAGRPRPAHRRQGARQAPGGPQTLPLDAKALDDYTGVYRFDAQTTRAFLREGGKLFAQRNGRKQEIFAVAPDEFVYPGRRHRLHFRRDAQGKVAGVDFQSTLGPAATGHGPTIRSPGERQEVKVDPSLYDAYAGDYELSPAFSIAVTREGDQLFAQATGQPKFEIFPESETRFFLKVVDAQIEFVRGPDGKVTGLDPPPERTGPAGEAKVGGAR